MSGKHKRSKTTIPKPDSKPVPKKSPGKRLLARVIAVLLLLVLVARIYVFYYKGYSGYMNTILLYAVWIAGCAAFIPHTHRTFKINAIVIGCILFLGETYLRFSGKGYINYTEKNNTNIFANFISPYLDYSKTRFIDQLWIDRPNHEGVFKTDEFAYHFQTNEIGMRERNHTVFKNKNTIVVLGDSFTWGQGAPADSTGVASMEHHLNTQGKQVLCYNAGISGSDICFMYKLYEKELRQLKPGVVILNLNHSDIFEIIKRGGDERFVGNTVKFTDGPGLQFLYSCSYIFRVVYHAFTERELTDDDSQEKLDRSLEIIGNKILDFYKLSKQDSFQLVVVFTPWLSEVANNQLVLSNIRDGLVLHYPEIVTIDMFSYIVQSRVINADNQFEYFYPKDMHFKPPGYWLWGRIISDTLLSKNIVK